MKVGLHCAFSDSHLDRTQISSQRQLRIEVSALPEASDQRLPLNLCLVLDHSGSMAGSPLQTVKQATDRIIDRLKPTDRLSIVIFDHQAQVLIPHQSITNPNQLKQAVAAITANGGTAIDRGIKLGIEELAKGKENAISQLFLLTDGENEHGDNQRCLKLAHLAADYGLTLSTLGFGDHWNQDILETIADAGGGSLTYIQKAEEVIPAFNRLFDRVQSIGLTNAHLLLNLLPGVRLAELKPLAQVAPDVIELQALQEASQVTVRLGDLMVDVPRIILANLYLSSQPPGTHPVVQVQVQYDSPLQAHQSLLSDLVGVSISSQEQYQPNPDPETELAVMALAKYRQTQIAEKKLKSGDRQAAATLLQSAAQTALQMGDHNAATVLQENATRLQTGQELSERDRKQTRIVSKTILQ